MDNAGAHDAAAAAASTHGLPEATAARVRAALPAGVHHKLLDGPWMLPATDVVFDVGASGARRVLARNATDNTVVYTGTLYGEPVVIEQARSVTPNDIDAWLERVQLQYSMRTEVAPAQLVYGALIDVDSGGVPAFYTVTQRPADSLASAVLALGGALAHIGATARLRLAWQSAGALAALHARRIVHGDITPANVLLSSAEDGETAVRVVGYTSTAGTTGSVAGDVHDWGALAWRVLTGAQPATDGPLPTAALVERGVPAAVVNALCECLSTDPTARPAMAVVARTLAAALAGSSRVAAVGGTGTGTTKCSVVTTSEPQSASAVAARDAMLQLALKTTSPEATRTLVTSGAGGAAAATLRAFVADAAVVRAACVALHNLSKTCGVEAVVQLQNDGVGSALTAALLRHANDTEVLRAACGALRNLSMHECARGRLVQCDSVGGALAAALRSEAADVAVACTASATLLNLAFDTDHLLALQRDGCGAAVVAMLERYVDNAEVAGAACGALQNLSTGRAEASLACNGAGTAVVGALQRHAGDANVAQRGCHVLGNLTTSNESRETLLGRDSNSVCAVVVAVLKQHVDNPSVVQAALYALWNICRHIDSCTPLARDNDAMAAIVAALQRHSGHLEVVRAACGTLRSLAAPIEGRKVLASDASVVAALVVALQRHGSDVKVATAGCCTIRYIADVEAGRTLLSRDGCGGGPAVAAVLKQHVGDASVAHAAMRALRSITKEESTCEPLVRDHGTADAIVAALQRHTDNVEMVRAACGTLRNLGNLESTRKQLVHVDGICVALLAALQRHGADFDVAIGACSAICNLAAEEVGRDLLVRDGGSAGAAVVAVLKRHAHKEAVAIAALGALYNISTDAAACVPLVRDHGAHSAIVAALRQHAGDVRVARVACDTLDNLATPPDTCALLVMDANICNAVVEALQRHGSDVEAATMGCGALWHLAREVTGQKLLARDDSACDAVVAALKQHAGNAAVVVAALRAIRNMSCEQSVCVRLLTALGVMPVIVAVLQRHTDNVNATRAACDVLSNLVDDKNPAAVEQAVVDALVAALQARGSDEDTVDNGCWALYCIVGAEANRALVVPERSTEVVVDLLQRHAGNARVAEAACSALRVLTQVRTVLIALPHVVGVGTSVLAALRCHVDSDAKTVYAIIGLLRMLAVHGCFRTMLGPLTSEHAADLRRIMATHPADHALQLSCDDVLTLLH